MSNQNLNLIKKHVQAIEHLNSLLKSIKWAPIFSTTTKRRLEVISAFIFIGIVLFGEIICFYVLYLLAFRLGVIGHVILIGYMTFMISDLRADENAIRGQGSKWVRGWSCWRHFADYFPVHLIKTADLPPNKNYLFACYPHGVISCAVFSNFGTDASNFHKLFPGIRSKICTLSYHFYFPLFRELVLSWGMMSAKYVSIKHALSQSTNKLAVVNQTDDYTSNGVVLVVGGAREALNARPGSYRICIKNRKGFIKIALETGASIVPVFSFGEVEVYDQPSNEKGSKLRKFQEMYKKWTGIAPALFIGRGFFQYSFGIIPQRKPIHTVVGAPINVEKNPSPSKNDVEELHQKFVRELEKLFNDHKAKYISNHENIELIME